MIESNRLLININRADDDKAYQEYIRQKQFQKHHYPHLQIYTTNGKLVLRETPWLYNKSHRCRNDVNQVLENFERPQKKVSSLITDSNIASYKLSSKQKHKKKEIFQNLEQSSSLRDVNSQPIIRQFSADEDLSKVDHQVSKNNHNPSPRKLPIATFYSNYDVLYSELGTDPIEIGLEGNNQFPHKKMSVSSSSRPSRGYLRIRTSVQQNWAIDNPSSTIGNDAITTNKITSLQEINNSNDSMNMIREVDIDTLTGNSANDQEVHPQNENSSLPFMIRTDDVIETNDSNAPDAASIYHRAPSVIINGSKIYDSDSSSVASESSKREANVPDLSFDDESSVNTPEGKSGISLDDAPCDPIMVENIITATDHEKEINRTKDSYSEDSPTPFSKVLSRLKTQIKPKGKELASISTYDSPTKSAVAYCCHCTSNGSLYCKECRAIYCLECWGILPHHDITGTPKREVVHELKQQFEEQHNRLQAEIVYQSLISHSRRASQNNLDTNTTSEIQSRYGSSSNLNNEKTITAESLPPKTDLLAAKTELLPPKTLSMTGRYNSNKMKIDEMKLPTLERRASYIDYTLEKYKQKELHCDTHSSIHPNQKVFIDKGGQFTNALDRPVVSRKSIFSLRPDYPEFLKPGEHHINSVNGNDWADL